MEEVRQTFKRFASLTHFQTEQMTAMRSLFPFIQFCCTLPGSDIQTDVPVWPSAVPLVCSIGYPKENQITPLDGTVALIAINNISAIFEIFQTCNESMIDEKSMEILINILGTHRELLTVLIPQLKPQNSETNELSTIEKLIKRIKGIEKEPRNEAKLTAALKDCKKVTKFVEKCFRSNFSYGIASELIKFVHQTILDMQTLGVFLNITQQTDYFTLHESNLNDVIECIFSGEMEDINDDINDLYQSLDECQGRIQQGVPLQNCIGKIYERLRKSISTLLEEIGKCDAKQPASLFVIPEPQTVYPTEFSDYLITTLSSLSTPYDDKLIKQVALSIYQRTTDPQIQYICSALTYLPEKAPGYFSMLTAIFPFNNELKKQQITAFLSTAMNLFNVFHSKCANVLAPLIPSLPPTIQNLINKSISRPETLEECYKCVIAFKYFENIAESYIADTQSFSICCDNIDRICISLFIGHAIYLRLIASDLIKFAVQFAEKNMNISKKTLGSILENFQALQHFSYSMTRYDEYEEMMNTIIKLTELVSHITKQIIVSAPASLTEADNEIATLSEKIKDTYQHFNWLQDALQPINDIPITVAKECAKSCINPMLSNLQSIMNTVQTQPEFAQQTRLGINLLMFELQQMLTTLGVEGSAEALHDVVGLFNTLQTAGSAPEIAFTCNNLSQRLIKFSQKLFANNIERDIIESIDLSDVNVLCDACARITDENLRNATIVFIQQSKTDPAIAKLFATQPAIVRSLLIARMKGVAVPNIDEIVAYSDKQLIDSRLEIAASIPILSTPSSYEKVNVLITQLLLSSSIQELRLTTNEIHQLITCLAPLNDSLATLTSELLTVKEEAIVEINSLASKYGATIYEANATDPRIHSVLNLSFLYAHVHQMKRPFSKELIAQQKDVIENNGDTKAAISTILASYMSAATENGCFAPEITYRAYQVSSDLNTFLQTGTSTDKKKLIESLDLLPTTFEKTGTLSQEFASVLSLSLSQDSESSEDVEEFIKILGLLGQTLESYLKLLYEMAPVEKNEPVLDTARINESINTVQKSMKKLLKATKTNEEQILLAKYQQFYASIDEMKRILSNSTDPKAKQILEQVEDSFNFVSSVITQVHQGDNSNVSKLVEVLNSMFKLFTQLTDSHIQSPLVDILAVLAEDIKEITNSIDSDPSDEEMASYEPLRKVTINEVRAVLHFTHSYIVESRKNVEGIMKESPIIDPEVKKAFIRAVNQLKEAAQVIYLLVRMTDSEDIQMKNKIIFGCRRYLAASNLFISQVLMPNGNAESERKIKESAESANKHVSSIIDFATQYGAAKKANAEENIEISTDMSLERLRLTARITKLRRALEIAQNNEKILSQ